MSDHHSHNHAHGSPHSWEEVYKDLDLSYSETANTQGKLFEMVKISFLEEIFPKPPARMLEVGCGSAFVSLYFAKRGYETTCLDVNEFILKVAKKNFAKENQVGKFVVGDAEKLPFKDNQFDIITSFGLLEHFQDPQQAINEMVRVLKPGGLFFADIVPNRFSVQSFGNIFNSIAVLGYWSMKGKLALGWQKAMKNFQPDYFENSITWQQYVQIIKKARLKTVRVQGNRPFPRLTLPYQLDQLYTLFMKPLVPIWKTFDRWQSPFPLVWGAGLWFWGNK